MGRLPAGSQSNDRTVLTADSVGLPLPTGALDHGLPHPPMRPFPQEDVEEVEPPVCQDCI